jgi:ATP-dependent exoDNAse (exonuclease V) alpha subunit
MSPIQLNEQQKSAMQRMNDFLKSDARTFLLQGYAGVGKSTVIQEFIKKHCSKRIAVTAPTNKAVKILKTIAQQWDFPDDFNFCTIHRLLGLEVKLDAKGESVLVRVKNQKDSFCEYDIIIIDEGSMVNQELWEILGGHIEKYSNPKIIFLGDRCQLPPVGEIESEVFTIDNGVELTQVMRQQDGNPVGLLVDATRKLILNNERSFLVECNRNNFKYKHDLSEGVWWLENDKWMRHILKAFNSPTYQSERDYCRVLAWTNKTVNNLNSYIRNNLFGDNALNPFVEGDRLIANNPIFKEGKDIIIPTSTEMEVINVNSGIVRWEDFSYNSWLLFVEDDESGYHLIPVLQKSSLTQWKQDVKELLEKAKKSDKKIDWTDYYQLKQLFADVNYAYCLTVHKSQGSTFNNVFVSLGDILSNRNILERHKCLYVAFSRASQRLIIKV